MVVAIARPPIAMPVEAGQAIDKSSVAQPNSTKSQFKRLTI
jgi:hypothetical protein